MGSSKGLFLLLLLSVNVVFHSVSVAVSSLQLAGLIKVYRTFLTSLKGTLWSFCVVLEASRQLMLVDAIFYFLN